MRKRQKLIGLLIALAIVFIVPALYYAYWLSPVFMETYEDAAKEVRFDQSEWLAGEEASAHPLRVHMIDDLLSQQDFHGKTRTEVTSLLGEPTDTPYFSSWDMVYWLGPERGFAGIDSEWLVFRFSEDSQVTEYQVVTD